MAEDGRYARRNCTRCTRWRLAVDFKWRWQKRRNGQRYETPTIDTVCQVCRRQDERDRYARLSDEAKRAKGIRANEQALKRRARLEEQVQRARQAAQSYARGAELDLTPFRMWLLGKARQEGGAVALASQIGTDEKNVRRWLHGYDWDNDDGWGGWAKCEPRAIRTVTIRIVDEVGIALGEPDLLERLYPFLEG